MACKRKNYDIGAFIVLAIFAGIALLILVSTVNPWYIIGPILAAIILKIWTLR